MENDDTTTRTTTPTDDHRKNEEKTPLIKIIAKNLEVIIAFIALVFSVISIFFSISSYSENKTIQEDNREYDLRLQLLEANEDAELQNNQDFLNYTIGKLISQLEISVGRNEDELFQLKQLVFENKDMAAYNLLQELGNKFPTQPEIKLLMCIMKARDSILKNQKMHSREDIDVVISMLNEILTDSIKEDYGTIIGIVYYQAKLIPQAIDAIRSEMSLFNTFSKVYSVGNYWLAKISIDTMSRQCGDFEVFLYSSYEDSYETAIMKCSIAKLYESFPTTVYSLYLPNRINSVFNMRFDGLSYVENLSDYHIRNMRSLSVTITSVNELRNMLFFQRAYYNLIISTFASNFGYLDYMTDDTDDKQSVTDLLYEFYENRDSLQNEFPSMSSNILNYEHYYDLYDELENFKKSLPRCLLETYSLADFYLLSYDSNLLSCLFLEDNIELFNMVAENDSREQAYQIFYEYLVTSIAYKAYYSHPRGLDMNSPDCALYAVAILRHYNELSDDAEIFSDSFHYDIEPYELAQFAYNEGYRYSFVYEYLLIMHTDNEDLLNKLHDEMDIMRYRY